MKNKTSTLFLVASFVFVTCLFISSCSSMDSYEGYDIQLANYKVAGTVTDEEGNPVKGIQVVPVFEYDGSDLSDLLYTDKEGKYDKSYSLSLAKSIILTFNDIDADANGGSFESITVKANIEETENAKGAFAGSYLVGYDAVLKRK